MSNKELSGETDTSIKAALVAIEVALTYLPSDRGWNRRGKAGDAARRAVAFIRAQLDAKDTEIERLRALVKENGHATIQNG